MTRAPSTESNRQASPDGPKNPFKPGPEAMPLRMADLACEELEQLEGIPRFQKHWPLAKRDEAIAATVAYLKRYGERFRENAASRAIRAAEPGDPESREGDPRVRPARPSGDGRRRGRRPGHLLARRRGGRGPPRRAAVVPDRRPLDEAGGLPRRSPVMRISDAKGHESPEYRGHADRPGLAGRGGARGGPLAALLRVRRPPCPDPRARRGDRIPRLLAARLVAALDRPGRPDRRQGGRDRPARSRSRSGSGTIAGSRRPPRPTSSATPTASPRSARGSPSGSSACPTSPSARPVRRS